MYTGVIILLLGSIHSIQSQDCSKLSLKARKLCREKQVDLAAPVGEYIGSGALTESMENHGTTPTPTTASLPVSHTTFMAATKRQGPVLYTVTTRPVTTNVFDDEFDDDEEEEEEHKDLPDCGALSKQQKLDGEKCREVETEPEIRWRDQIFEKLLPQIWDDYQKKMKYNREIFGVELEPFHFGNYNLNQSEAAYEIQLNMTDIQIHGLSTIYLKETLVTRSESLGDLDIKLGFQFDKLRINGTYTAKGSVGFWATINSYGEQDFDIVLENATVSPSIRLETTNEFRAGCTEGGSVQLTKIEVPIKWSDMSINFTNLGALYNSILNMVGVVLLNTQESNLVELVKESVKKELDSLLC